MNVLPEHLSNQDVLARTLYGEARGQPIKGLEAVANVIMNRVQFAMGAGGHFWWGNSIKSVCLKPMQFSCWNYNDPNRRIITRPHEVLWEDVNFRDCYVVAKQALDYQLQDNTKGSMHYVNPKVANPPWIRGKTPAVIIGDHAFYNDIE